MKKETIWSKMNKVHKELRNTLKKVGVIQSLTEEQRCILTIGVYDYNEPEYKSFTCDSSIWIEDVTDGGIFNNKDEILKAVEEALNKCEKWAKDKNLVYVSYGFDSYNGSGGLSANGYVKRSDKELIDEFSKNYWEEEADIKAFEEKIEKQMSTFNKGSSDAVIELRQNELEMAADTLAVQLGAKNRSEMFTKLVDKGYDGLDVELTISAYKHLLEE